MTTLNMVAKEIRGFVSGMTGTPEEKRAELMESLKATYQFTEMTMAFEIMMSPEVGFAFATKVQESLGAVNEVVFKEFGIMPVHIKELELATIETIEEVLEITIDEFFNRMTN